MKPIDPRLVAVVERMFERCFADAEFTQASLKLLTPDSQGGFHVWFHGLVTFVYLCPSFPFSLRPPPPLSPPPVPHCCGQAIGIALETHRLDVVRVPPSLYLPLWH